MFEKRSEYILEIHIPIICWLYKNFLQNWTLTVSKMWKELPITDNRSYEKLVSEYSCSIMY